MGNDLILYNALKSLVADLGEMQVVEFEILSQNRAKYREFLFNFDAVVGYAKDLRLIEYRVEDEYYEREKRARKVIYIYRYGTHPDSDERIIKRRESDPSGFWERYFPGVVQNDILQLSQGRNRGREDNQDRGGNYLPPQHS